MIAGPVRLTQPRLSERPRPALPGPTRHAINARNPLLGKGLRYQRPIIPIMSCSVASRASFPALHALEGMVGNIVRLC